MDSAQSIINHAVRRLLPTCPHCPSPNATIGDELEFYGILASGQSISKRCGSTQPFSSQYNRLPEDRKHSFCAAWWARLSCDSCPTPLMLPVTPDKSLGTGLGILILAFRAGVGRLGAVAQRQEASPDVHCWLGAARTGNESANGNGDDAHGAGGCVFLSGT